MNGLDAIEQRIDKLTQILGSVPDDGTNKSENLTDSLLSANTLLSSAMSGRQSILDIVARTNELESYMDPGYLDERQDCKAKEVYVNTVAPELAANFESLDKINKLQPTLGAEYFRNIPDVGENLRQMKELSHETKQKNDLFEESLTIAMQRYDEIQSGIKESLKQMNERLDQLEDRLKQKKKANVDE